MRPTLNCNLPGADALEVRVRVRLAADGRIIGSPQLLRPSSDPAYRAVSDSVLRGVRAAAPFDMPAGYEEQDINFIFNTATWC